MTNKYNVAISIKKVRLTMDKDEKKNLLITLSHPLAINI